MNEWISTMPLLKATEMTQWLFRAVEYFHSIMGIA